MKTLKFIRRWVIGSLGTLLLVLIGVHCFRQYRQEVKDRAFQSFQTVVSKEYDSIDFFLWSLRSPKVT